MKFKDVADFWFNLPRVVRYIFTGGYNAGVSYLLFVICVFIFTKDHPQLCLFLSFMISSVNSYLSQKFLVFQTRGNYLKEYVKCFFTWLSGYPLNAILLKILYQNLHINIFVSQFICLGTVAIFTYILFKYFSFKTSRD